MPARIPSKPKRTTATRKRAGAPAASKAAAATERKHFAVDAPTPIDAIKFRMDQQGLTVADLEPYIGARNRVYEVLAGKRPLTLAMIRRLSAGLGIPAGVLVAA